MDRCYHQCSCNISPPCERCMECQWEDFGVHLLHEVVNPYRDVPGGFSPMCNWCPGLPGSTHSKDCPWVAAQEEEK
jgi:hypothetical protein